jgi:hypothetical protein
MLSSMPHLLGDSAMNDELVMAMASTYAMAITFLSPVTRLTEQHTFLLRT